MATGEQAEEALKQHLHQAISRLHEDIDEVEFWVEALRGFSQPVPDYEPSELRFPALKRANGNIDYTRIGMRT
jgi:hypothetical protein